MFTVVITEKDGADRRMTFTEPEVTVGRIPGNDVVLPKGNVSKRHSRIVLKDNRFIVVDLKSTNGTYVNGRKITSPVVVKEGDKIYVGDYILMIEGAPPLDALKPPSLLPALPEGARSGLGPLSPFGGRGGEGTTADEAIPVVLRGGPFTNSSAPPTSVASSSERPRGPDSDSIDGADGEPILRVETELEVFEERSSREQERLPDGEISARAFPRARFGDERRMPERPAQRTTRDEMPHDTLLGPIDFVLADPEVFHVVVERFDRIRADRGSGLRLEQASFASPEALVEIAQEVAAQAGVAAGAASYDVSLANGQHVVAVLPAAASNGAVMSVRRRPTRANPLSELAQHELASAGLTAKLEEALRQKRHVWIVGPGGVELASFASNVLAMCEANDRAALFERAPEIALGERSAICLKLGTVPINELLERVRSFRPDRLVIHGLREEELHAVLDAFAQRADGNIAAFEARSAKDALHAFDRAVGADVALRAVSLMVELRRDNGRARVVGAYDIELDASGDLNLKAL